MVHRIAMELVTQDSQLSSAAAPLVSKTDNCETLSKLLLLVNSVWLHAAALAVPAGLAKNVEALLL